MKKLIYTLMFLSVLGGCKDDEEKDASIVGTWQGDRLEVKAGNGIVNFYEETDEDFNGTVTFTADGTATFKRDNVESQGTYTLNGDKLTTNADLDLYSNMTGPYTFDVVVLSEKQLHLKLKQTQEVNVPDVGTVPVTVTGSIEFNRQ